MYYVEVEIRNNSIFNTYLPSGCFLHVYDYSKKWHKDVVEPDEKGVMCKQTIYAKDKQTTKFSLYMKDGEVFRVDVPQDWEVLVKTYLEENNPQLKKWLPKRF